MLSLNKILAALPGLNQADIAAVRAAADSLLTPSGTSQAAVNEGAAVPLFDAVTRALGLRMGFAAFQGTATYKTYRRGSQAIDNFLAENLAEACTRVSRNAMLSLLVECLIDDLKGRHVPISLGTVCSNLERAPQVFRAAFPGYIENGLGHLIFKSMTRSK